MSTGNTRNMYRKPYVKDRKSYVKKEKMSKNVIKNYSYIKNENGYSEMMCTKNSGNIEPKLITKNIKCVDEQKIIEKIWEKESYSEIEKRYTYNGKQYEVDLNNYNFFRYNEIVIIHKNRLNQMCSRNKNYPKFVYNINIEKLMKQNIQKTDIKMYGRCKNPNNVYKYKNERLIITSIGPEIIQRLDEYEKDLYEMFDYNKRDYEIDENKTYEEIKNDEIIKKE